MHGTVLKWSQVAVGFCTP